MATTGAFLYLSSADIDALKLTSREMADAVEAAYRALAQGGARSVPKSGFDVTASTFFHAMPARYDDKGVVGTKWIGTALNAGEGLPHINAMIVINDIATAVVQAVMDGTVITAVRPAAVSLVAARQLARPDSSRISFYPCGVQALAHLDFFATEFPLREVTCFSRTTASAEAFAEKARERGFYARVVTQARDAVEGQDIVISSAPRAANLAKVLDPAWLSSGAYVSGVDLGRAWLLDNLRQLEILATDNHDQSREAAATGVISWVGEYDAELSELVAQTRPARTSPAQRAFFLHPGLGLGDVAIAAMAIEHAKKRKIGTMLAR